MAKVISKLRAYSPNKKETPTGNVKHLYYIATRTNAVANEYGNTIFGYYDYKNIPQNIQKKEVAKYIKNISEMKNNVYRGIVSLKENDAIRLGYSKRENWESMIKKNIYDIAKIVNIPFSRLEYCGVVHLKKGNPHLHYMFWDKQQKINRCFISTYQQNKIRDVLTKGIYKEELQELYAERELLKDDLKSRDLVQEMKTISIESCNSKVPYIKIKNSDKQKLINQFKKISKKLPKTRKISLCFCRRKLKI